MPLTEYYHVRDPIENLLIHVTLRKIAGLGNDGTKDLMPVGRTWRYHYRWQEKKLSISEKNKEQEHLEAKGIQLSSRKRGGRRGSEADMSDILSSYVDVDDFIPAEFVKDPPSTSNASTHLAPPDLNRRPRSTDHSAAWTLNHQRAWLRSNREDKFRAMHIVALIEGVQRVLCSLRFYKETGLLCVTPGFSTPIVDLENDPDLLVKGPKLATYQLRTHSGCLYEYVIDNTNELLPFASAGDQRLSRELQLQEEKRDKAEVGRWQNAGKKPGSFVASSAKQKRMLSLEVISINNPRTTDPIFVEYELVLPDHGSYPQWRFQTGDLHRRHGTTPLSIPQRFGYLWWTSTAAFGWHQHFRLKLATERHLDTHPPEIKEQPLAAAAAILHLRVYSRDSWRRKRTEGFTEITLQESSGFYDFEVPIRRSIMSVRDQMEELFLGIDETYDNKSVNEHQSQILSDASPISSMITSRLGQKSESTGSTIRIRYNIVDLCPSKRDAGSRASRQALDVSTSSKVGSGVVKRSVQEILQSVKLEKRLASIADTRVRAALRSTTLSDAPVMVETSPTNKNATL